MLIYTGAIALECLRFASEMTEQGCKMVLLDMAQSWLSLADQAEKNAKLDQAAY